MTGGCGTGIFCPGNNVTAWQVMVWLGRAPSLPGGGTWATYRPVPRGSIYTLRDEQNRVVTEMAGGLSGSSSATLAVQRDNVFLGSLLVASRANSAWTYSVSDHLGSIRAIWNASGTKFEDHKYWPYGEDSTALLTQHLGFQTMERNDGAAQYFDHARTQQFNLGRFVSTDPLFGIPASVASWNRYSFALSNPLRYTDPDGLETDNPSGSSRVSKGDSLIERYLLSWLEKRFPSRSLPANDQNLEAMNEDVVGNTPEQAERMANPGGTAQTGVVTGGSAVAGALLDEGVKQGAIAVAAGTIRIVGKGFELGEHALLRMEQRGVSVAQVEAVLKTAEPFAYNHGGMVKSGYYDSATRLFVAVVDKSVRTVITNVKPQYIENLKRLP